VLQRALRAGDRHVRRHPVHERLLRRRGRLHEGAGLLLARLLQRALRGRAVQGRERRLHGECGVLLEHLPGRAVSGRSREPRLPAHGRDLHVGLGARVLHEHMRRDHGSETLRLRDGDLPRGGRGLHGGHAVLPRRLRSDDARLQDAVHAHGRRVHEQRGLLFQ